MPRAVRIARIITRLNIGGPAIQAATLSARLNGQEFETLLVYGRPDRDEGDIRSVLDPGSFHGAYVSSLRRPLAPLSDMRALAAVYRLLCHFRPAIIHTHTAKAGAVGRLAALAYNQTYGRRRPARTVHTYHGHIFEGYFRPGLSAGFVAVERQLARCTDVLITISPRIQDDIVAQYRIGRPEQVRVVPLGFDLGPFAALDGRSRTAAREGLGLPDDALVVTTVGRLAPIKQQALFLDMASRLVATRREAIFLIVGDGALRGSLEQLADNLGLADSVRFLGWRGDLPRVYAATDVFVLTSANEGTPVALIEAMASGVASVSTDVGGVRDVITDSECGIIVPPGDVDALADSVSTLLDNETLRHGMGATARASVLPRFALNRLVRDISDLYRDIL